MIGGHVVVHPSPGVEPAALLGKVGLQLLDHLVRAGAGGSPSANKSFGGKVSVAVPHGILELVLHVRAGQADRQQVLGLDVQAA